MDAEFYMGDVPKPDIRVEEFWTAYLPPLPGSNSGEMRAVDMVRIAPRGQKLSAVDMRIKDVERDEILKNVVMPAYERWKQGQNFNTVDGTPLAMWPGLQKNQIGILQQNDCLTLEDLARMGDAQRHRIGLPNMVGLIEGAKRFLEARDGSKVEAALAERDAKIDALNAQLAQMMDYIRAQTPVVVEDEDEPKKRGPGRPRKDEAAA